MLCNGDINTSKSYLGFSFSIGILSVKFQKKDSCLRILLTTVTVTPGKGASHQLAGSALVTYETCP